MLETYLLREDLNDILNGIQRLNNPQAHSKMVELGIVNTLERNDSDRQSISKLFSLLSRQKILSEEDFKNGFIVVVDSIDDLEIDIPFVSKLVGQFLGLAVLSGCIPATFVDNLKEKIREPTKKVINDNSKSPFI